MRPSGVTRTHVRRRAAWPNPAFRLCWSMNVFQEAEVAMSRKLWIGLAVAVAVLTVAVATVSAHRTGWATDIRDQNAVRAFQPRLVTITGHVYSVKSKCRAGRNISASARETQGTDSPGDDTLTPVGTDITRDGGVFEIRGIYPQGTDDFLLQVAAKNIGGRGHRHMCRFVRELAN